MGFFGKIKAFLNIGGVSIKMKDVTNPFVRGATTINGVVELTTKSDKIVLDTAARFYVTTTKKEDGEEKSEEETLGKWSAKEYLPGEYPFEIKPGEVKTIEFMVPNIHLPKTLAAEKGMLGAVGKLAAFASKAGGTKMEYTLEVTADVKGTPLDPSAKAKINVVDPS